MNVAAGLLAGLLLTALEAAWRARLGVAPDLLAVALGGWLLRAPSRRLAGGCVGLLVGASAGSADPIGALLLGGGLAAALLLPLRGVVFAESAATHAVFAGGCALALRLARELHAWVGSAPELPWTRDAVTAPLLSAVALPILARVGGGIRRGGRGLVAAFAAWRGRARRSST